MVEVSRIIFVSRKKSGWVHLRFAFNIRNVRFKDGMEKMNIYNETTTSTFDLIMQINQ